jgi:regulatory protein
MKVTKIEPGRFKKEFVTVFFGTEFHLKLHQDVAAAYRLAEGAEVPEEKIAEIKAAGRKKEALEYAMLFLSYRPRSQREMSERLKRKGFEPEVTAAVLEDLKNLRLIDDSQFARDLAESRIKNRLQGDARVREDLIRKGIDRKLAEDAVRDLSDAEREDVPDEDERAYQALVKRRNQIHNADDRTVQRRLFGYLSRRGFAYDTVERALQRFKRESRSGEAEE